MPAMCYVDAHTHNRLALPHVQKVVTVAMGEELPSGQGVYASVGVHPWMVSGPDDFARDEAWLFETAASERVWAIGECGLDKAKGPSLDVQQRWFDVHVAVSEQLRKPLIIHCVRAFNEIYTLKKQRRPLQPWMLHGFTGSPQMAKQLCALGLFVSFGLNKNGLLPHAVGEVPLSQLFFETDVHATTIGQVYDAAALRLDTGLGSLKETVLDNFNRFYNRKMRDAI